MNENEQLGASIEGTQLLRCYIEGIETTPLYISLDDELTPHANAIKEARRNGFKSVTVLDSRGLLSTWRNI